MNTQVKPKGGARPGAGRPKEFYRVPRAYLVRLEQAEQEARERARNPPPLPLGASRDESLKAEFARTYWEGYASGIAELISEIKTYAT
jgi:hypothetical protein